MNQYLICYLSDMDICKTTFWATNGIPDNVLKSFYKQYEQHYDVEFDGHFLFLQNLDDKSQIHLTELCDYFEDFPK